MKPSQRLGTLPGVMALVVFISLSGPTLAQTPTEAAQSKSAVKTDVTNGEVLYVSDNNVVLRLEDGRVEHFVVPTNWRFKIDGKELEASQLQPGTKITTTMISTNAPEVVRTTSIRSGTVWHAQGNKVILRMDDTQENEEFVVPDWYKFTVNGKPADVHQLQKGMHVIATKVVEMPASDAQVGQPTP